MEEARETTSHGRRVAALCVAAGLLLAAWVWAPETAIALQRFSNGLAPYRHAWYALPIVVAAFVVLGLVLVPVMLLIAATGLVFGPLLGPLYALAGCIASASTGFAIGRWMGARRVERLGGHRVTRITRALRRNGTLAVFLLRKVPAPFTLTNIVVGASTVRYQDFILGTVLGMAAIIVALAGFGYQLTELWRHPSPRTLAMAILLVSVPLTLAWLINRAVRRARVAG